MLTSIRELINAEYRACEEYNELLNHIDDLKDTLSWALLQPTNKPKAEHLEQIQTKLTEANTLKDSLYAQRLEALVDIRQALNL